VKINEDNISTKIKEKKRRRKVKPKNFGLKYRLGENQSIGLTLIKMKNNFAFELERLLQALISFRTLVLRSYLQQS